MSQQPGTISYQVTLKASVQNQMLKKYLQLQIPVTSLCPCSKKLSDYGAHNQRSHVTLKALLEDNLSIQALIQCIEQQGSSEVYSTLKREDEKYVTETAYENPKFAEDMVRDMVRAARSFEALHAFSLEARNIESIHDHDAFAKFSNFPESL